MPANPAGGDSPATPGGRGLFVVVEGLDGAGTTTQTARIADWLRGFGVPVEVTREPSSGPFGALLRLALEHRLDLDRDTLALAFAADRADHTRNPVNGIDAHLAAGRWVVCDRYVLSSLAYQGREAAPGVTEWLLTINARALVPDVTIFIDTSEDVCLQRVAGRSANAELFHSREALRDIRAAYRRLAAARPPVLGHLVVIDGDPPEAAVAAEIIDRLAAYLAERDPRWRKIAGVG